MKSAHRLHLLVSLLIRGLDVGCFRFLADEEVYECERSMRRWERQCVCAWVLGQSKRLFHRSSWRWVILIVAVGLLLCWDAGISQGCSGEESCNRLFSNQVFVRNGHHEQREASFKHRWESYAQRESEKKAMYRDQSKSIGTMHNSLVDASVGFNESVLLLLNPPFPGLRDAVRQDRRQLVCVYARSVYTKVLSVEDGFVGCKHPRYALRKSLTGTTVSLEFDGFRLHSGAVYGKIGWKKLVYGWVPLLAEGDALLFVKGLAHSKRSLLPQGLECQYGDNVRTQVVAFCQENVRCKLPPERSQHELVGKQVTLVLKDTIFSSVVTFSPLSSSEFALHRPPEAQAAYYLCACTLLWNGAKFMKEWVMYHSHIGVQRFFFYDNNSDDDIELVLESLQFYNVSRHPWPWLKTQEASFAHCAIRAAQECTWVAFIDLDEFIFPRSFLSSKQAQLSQMPLHALINQYDHTVNKGKLGQLKISNFNFGPSGLHMLPKSGQMVNYICRMSVPRRVKSIVRVSAIHPSYCSRVHHFELKGGFVSVQTVRKDAVIHHYKYQVWEDFKLKFVRRAATFVTDWGQNKDLDSFDRTPGLGTDAVEPSDWAHQFCEIQDTALREYVMNASELHFDGKLVWE